mgnify:CR=1 FL=1
MFLFSFSPNASKNLFFFISSFSLDVASLKDSVIIFVSNFPFAFADNNSFVFFDDLSCSSIFDNIFGRPVFGLTNEILPEVGRFLAFC